MRKRHICLICHKKRNENLMTDPGRRWFCKKCLLDYVLIDYVLDLRQIKEE